VQHAKTASVLTHSVSLIPDLFDLKVSGEYYPEDCEDYWCYGNSFEISEYYTPPAPDVKFQKNAVSESYNGNRHQTIYFAKNWTAQETTIYVTACRNWNYAASPAAFKIYMYDGDRRIMYETGALQNSRDCADFTVGPVDFTAV
jgi:hypothetical protein